MTDAPPLMTVAEAEAILDAEAVGPRTTDVAHFKLAGFRLAQEVVADRDFPPFDRAQMDGFAVRSADTAEDPYELGVVGEVAAGARRDEPLGPGEAVAIMTGAPVPPGADAVVPVERSELIDGGRVRLSGGRVEPGKFVASRGSDRRRGEVLLRAGGRVGPAQAAVVAAVGAWRVKAYQIPPAAVLVTGDEVVPIHAAPGPTQIRNSNGAMLAALLRRMTSTAGGDLLPDDPAAIRAAIERLMPQIDVLLLTGGMSMGRYDHVPRILRDLGCEFRISKVAMKPGKPFVFAVLPAGKSGDGRPRYVFGLPGNPVSAFVCTLRLASRLIARLGGGPADEFTRTRPGVLAEPLPANGPREFYQPCRFDGRTVVPLRWRGSADVFTLADADALIVRPADDPPQDVGTSVEVLEIPR